MKRNVINFYNINISSGTPSYTMYDQATSSTYVKTFDDAGFGAVTHPFNFGSASARDKSAPYQSLS